MSISNLFSPNDDSLYCNNMYANNVDSPDAGILNVGLTASQINIGNTGPNPVYINGKLYPQSTALQGYISVANTCAAGNYSLIANGVMAFDQGSLGSPNSGIPYLFPTGFQISITQTGIYMYDLYISAQPTGLNCPLCFGVSINGLVPTAENQFYSNFTSTGESNYTLTGSGLIPLNAGDLVQIRNRTQAGSIAVLFQATPGGTTPEDIAANAKFTLIKVA